MRRDESGFTLIEVLIAVVLLGLLGVAVGLLLTTVLKINVQTSTGIAEARRTELTIAYFNDDVRNATTVAGPLTTPPQATQTCGTGAATAGSLILEITGRTFAGAGATAPVIVSYVTRTDPVNGISRTQLHRLTCAVAGASADDNVVLDILISPTPSGDGATCTIPAAPLGTRSCTMTTTPCPSEQIIAQPAQCTPTNPGTGGVPYLVNGTTRKTTQ